MAKSASEIASEWYTEDEIFRCLQDSGSRVFGAIDPIPTDVKSREFAAWLTHQYRLAMAKGIHLGRTCEAEPDASR